MFSLCKGLSLALVGLIVMAGLASPLCAWTNEAYVWQRQGGEDLATALAQQLPGLDGVAVLAAEITWKQDRPVCQRFASSLVNCVAAMPGQPQTIVVHIAPFAGPFVPGVGATKLVTEQIRFVVATAELAGAHINELQVDFDCGETELKGFALWLRGFREAVPGRKLVFTLRPAWLGKPGLTELLKEADAFVLQLYGLEKPARLEALAPLCEVTRAATWVAEAGKLGKPLRVALPTYSNLLAFDVRGDFAGYVSEANRQRPPQGLQLREQRADETQMAVLARVLRLAHPANCEGLLWCRLPVANERLNWSPAAFARIVRGDIPKALARVSCMRAKTGEGLYEFVYQNESWALAEAPARVEMSWEGDSPLSATAGAEGRGPYSLKVDAATRRVILECAKDSQAPRVSGGGSLVLGWVRVGGQTLTLTPEGN